MDAQAGQRLCWPYAALSGFVSARHITVVESEHRSQMYVKCKIVKAEGSPLAANEKTGIINTASKFVVSN